MREFRAVVLVAGLLAGSGCAAVHESAVRRDLSAVGRTLASPGEVEAPEPDGSLASYVAFAMAQSPELRAAYERWRSATLRISRARALPEPMVTYGFYALSVQTRVGPQRHRLGVRQQFPWPTRLTAAADAQSSRARAAQHRFEARALAVGARVAEAWWRLWFVRRAQETQRDQIEVLAGLSEALRTRVETNQATLAELAQVDLARSRAHDTLEGLTEQEVSAGAMLRAAVGGRDASPLPTVGSPSIALPSESLEALRTAVRDHPYLLSFERMADAETAQAAALEADRFPRFVVGLDWIETGPAPMPVQGSGDDALILNVGISVPLWQEAYEESQRAAEADAEAARADGRSAEDAAQAELTQALSAVRDSHRRSLLYRDTLLPQAQSAFESVIGAYVVGRGTVAGTLLAQRDLLELSLGLQRALADHGRAWARLERVVGRSVEVVTATGFESASASASDSASDSDSASGSDSDSASASASASDSGAGR